MMSVMHIGKERIKVKGYIIVLCTEHGVQELNICNAGIEYVDLSSILS